MTSGTHSPESGQTFTSEIQQQQRSCDAKAQGLIMCKVEVDQIDGPKVDGGAASVVPAAAGATERAIAATAAAAGVAGEDKKPRIGRELKGDHKLQVKVGHRNTTESGESEQMNNHSESKDSSKHEGSSIFEGKVTVTRSSSRRRLGVQPVTPRLEEPRAVRPNRGVKRRYPGEESDENNSSRKRTRVRSMSRVCGPNGQPTAITEIQTRGKVSGGKDWKQRMRGQRRDRQSEVYLCNFEGCEKSFTESSALYNHGRVHGDRPYLCHYEGCSKRFSERSKLKRHFLIHTGEKPFICVYEGCGKAFSLDFNLRSHMKTHTGEYHECPHAGCEKRYCQEYKLRAHICKEHKGTANGKAVVAENGAVVSKEESVISSNDKATKKKQKVEQLQAQKGKLQKCVDGRKKRIQELELELEGETKELNKCEKALRKVMREQEQVEFGGYCVEQELSSDNPGEGELGEVYAEEKEVVMFAHTLPTADQGTRLMDQVVLIQGTGRPLSPSISSSQEPFFMPRLQLNSSQPSGNRPIHFLPYGNSSHSTSDCFYGVGSSRGTAEDSHLLNGFSSLQERSPVDDPQAGDGGVSQLFSTDCRDSQTDSFLHEQSSQCEPPVSQLFTYQEQPCLV